MSLPELALILAERGIGLTLRLVVDAPRGALTPDVRDALEEHKPMLLMGLARQAQWDALKDQRWGPAVEDPTPGIVIP
jgi:hypothetical protein